jgi:very-short-patch-repair endonuclease
LEKKLVIEVDGGQHAEMLAQDMKRTEFLNNQGYNALRFWNNEVLRETDSVLQVILSHLTMDDPLTLTLSPKGERGY